MSLRSQLFRGDSKLEAAAISDPAHIQKGAVGPHVGKIQKALLTLDKAGIDSAELQGARFGSSTANAVLAYKQKRNIINRSYQTKADDIVGKMTIQSLDRELSQPGPLPLPQPAPPAPAPIPLPVPKEWFVTELNLSSLSAVVAFGFTAAVGKIKFERANGESVTLPIGLFGPSVGLSLAPDFGKLLAKVPGLSGALSRFPVLQFLITPNPLGAMPLDIMLRFLKTSNPFVSSPAVRAAIETVIKGLTGSHENFFSLAIGEAFGRGGRELNKGDFSGPCISFSVGGTIGPGNFGIFLLFFGLDQNVADLLVSNPAALFDLTRLEAHSKGVAVISAGSLSAAIPGLGAGATVFFGEIV